MILYLLNWPNKQLIYFIKNKTMHAMQVSMGEIYVDTDSVVLFLTQCNKIDSFLTVSLIP